MSAATGGLLRRHRDFRLLWAGQVTGKYGDCVASVALPLVAVRLGASSLEIGSLTAAAWLPWLLIGLPVGALVDRMARRPLMIGASAASAVLFAAVPLAAWCGLLSYGLLLAVASLNGACAVVFQSAYGAYLPSLLAPDDRAEGNAKLNGSASAAQLAGLSTGGVIVSVFGAVSGLLANAATFVVSAVSLAAIRHREEPPATAEAATMGRQIREGVVLTFRDPWLRTGTLWGAAANFALTGYGAINVVFLVRAVGLTPGAVGLLMAATGAGGIAGAFAARRFAARVGTARAFVAAGLGLCSCALLMPLTTRGAGVLLYAAGGIGVAGGVVMGNVLWATFRQSYVPTEMFGRLSASGSVLNYGLMPLGALTAGVLASAFGLRDAMWITTAGVPLTGLILLLSPIAHHRDLPVHTLGERPPTAPGTAMPAAA